MSVAYVTVYTWDWKPIGQVRMDLSPLERNGEIDRAELDDATQKVVFPLLEGKHFCDVHILVHEGAEATPEELLLRAKKHHIEHGPDTESWGRNRRIRKPGPVKRRLVR